LGIEAFASGGTVKWQSASNVSVGYATSAGDADTLDGYHATSFLTSHQTVSNKAATLS
jgi:hypothetical protein